MIRSSMVRGALAALAMGIASLALAGVQDLREVDSIGRARINAAAHFMAGLADAPHALANTAAWKDHTDYMHAAWSRLSTRQVAAMSTWRDAELGRACPSGGTLMYPFSGPDFLNAHWLFPGCGTYVMFGLEHIGAVPDIGAMSERAQARLTADVRKAMENFISRNYFITDSMARQLRTSHLRGVLPVFMLSMALSGMEIVRIAPHELAPVARETPAQGQPMRQLKGVTIEYLAPGSPSIHRVHYFTVDAADKGLAHHPEFLAYVRGLAPATTFVKSASYLLHGNEFRQMRSALLDISGVIVQDDTGVPYSMLENRGWNVQLHGRYGRPIPPFGGSFQVALSRAYKTQEAAPLPFTFGYQYHDFRDSRSNLIVAQRATNGVPRQSR